LKKQWKRLGHRGPQAAYRNGRTIEYSFPGRISFIGRLFDPVTPAIPHADFPATKIKSLQTPAGFEAGGLADRKLSEIDPQNTLPKKILKKFSAREEILFPSCHIAVEEKLFGVCMATV
jgi:hypothetical protein